LLFYRFLPNLWRENQPPNETTCAMRQKILLAAAASVFAAAPGLAQQSAPSVGSCAN
jgi:hypothetical protein